MKELTAKMNQRGKFKKYLSVNNVETTGPGGQ